MLRNNTIMALVCLISITGSCQKDDIPAQKASLERLQVVMVDAKMPDITKSGQIAENAIDLNILAYDSDGLLEGHIYKNGATSSTLILKQGEKTLVAIINMGPIDITRFPNLESIRNHKVYQTSGSGGNMIFAGAIDVLVSKTSRNFTINVKRLLAKFTFLFNKTNLSPGVNIEITSISLKNVPAYSLLLDHNKASLENLCQNGDILSDGSMEPPMHNYATPLYMFENLQGNIGMNSNPVHKHPGEKENICSYVEITANYSSPDKTGIIKFRNFPGLNTTNNYDIERGRHYMETIKFNGSSAGEISWRVDVSGLITIGNNVQDVTISTSSLELKKEDNYQFSASITPSNASNKNISWSSSNTQVLTIDPNTGMATAHAPGNAVVTVTTQEGGFTDQCHVTVYDHINISVNKHLIAGEQTGTPGIISHSVMVIYCRADMPTPSNMELINNIYPFVTINTSYSYTNNSIYNGTAQLRLDLTENNDRPWVRTNGHIAVVLQGPVTEEYSDQVFQSLTITPEPDTIFVQGVYISW